jgi:hypothetical protein
MVTTAGKTFCELNHLKTSLIGKLLGLPSTKFMCVFFCFCFANHPAIRIGHHSVIKILVRYESRGWFQGQYRNCHVIICKYYRWFVLQEWIFQCSIASNVMPEMWDVIRKRCLPVILIKRIRDCMLTDFCHDHVRFHSYTSAIIFHIMLDKSYYHVMGAIMAVIIW